MAFNVKFLKGTAAGYENLGTQISTDTFYYTTDDNNLYLGEIKLSNGADLAAAIERIGKNETDIAAITAQLTVLTGEGDGSIKKMIADAKADLEAKIKVNADAIAAINHAETGILAQAKAHADKKDAAIQAAQNAADAAQGEVDALELVVDAMYKNTKIDELVADAKKAGTDAQADVDALELKVGTVADGETVVGMISKAGTDAKVTLTAAETATEGYLKTYVIAQGTTEIGKIDIPKELVVTAGEVVVDPEGQPAGTYVKLTIANQDKPIFINVKDLVDVYTAQANATQVQLVISDTNEISATIVAGSIDTTELANASVTAEKLADSAKALFDEAGAADDAETNAKKHATDLNTAMDERVKELEEAVGEGGSVDSQIDAKIGELDATVASTDVEEGKGLKVTTVQTDGKLVSVAVEGNFDNSYDEKGAAATAEQNAKDYADGLADDYDPAGSAATAESNAKSYTDKAEASAKSYTDAALSWGTF